MPEGPSIVILREALAPFSGKKVLEVTGNSKLSIARMKDKKVFAFKSWGKHFLICFRALPCAEPSFAKIARWSIVKGSYPL